MSSTLDDFPQFEDSIKTIPIFILKHMPQKIHQLSQQTSIVRDLTIIPLLIEYIFQKKGQIPRNFTFSLLVIEIISGIIRFYCDVFWIIAAKIGY